MVAKTDRHDAIRELKRAGLSVGDIAEKIGCSRQTIWRACKGIEPVPPAPTPTPDGNGHVDLEAARGVGLAVLVNKARNGSVSAAASVFKIASAELRADKCVDHVALTDVVKGLHAQYSLWRMHLQGSFTRRLLMEYEDLDPGQLELLIDDAIDGITKELNLRFKSEENTHA